MASEHDAERPQPRMTIQGETLTYGTGDVLLDRMDRPPPMPDREFACTDVRSILGPPSDGLKDGQLAPDTGALVLKGSNFAGPAMTVWLWWTPDAEQPSAKE